MMVSIRLVESFRALRHRQLRLSAKAVKRRRSLASKLSLVAEAMIDQVRSDFRALARIARSNEVRARPDTPTGARRRRGLSAKGLPAQALPVFLAAWRGRRLRAAALRGEGVASSLGAGSLRGS